MSFASTAITRVTSVTFDLGGQLIYFGGDNDRFATVVANNFNQPRITVTGGDVATLMGFGPGVVGTFLATQLDAIGATGGAINWTCANAVHGTSSDSGPFSQFASGNAEWGAISSDGATSPLSFTRS